MRPSSLCSFISIIGLTASLTVDSHSHKHLINPQTIHEFPLPTWVENIAVRQNDQILVDIVTSPEIYLLDPHPNSTATLIHNFTSYLALLGSTWHHRNITRHIPPNRLKLHSSLQHRSRNRLNLDSRPHFIRPRFQHRSQNPRSSPYPRSWTPERPLYSLCRKRIDRSS